MPSAPENGTFTYIRVVYEVLKSIKKVSFGMITIANIHRIALIFHLHLSFYSSYYKCFIMVVIVLEESLGRESLC